MFSRLLALSCALLVPVLAQTTPPVFVDPAAPGSADVLKNGSLEVSRSGNEVLLNWVLPAGEVRLLEIYRNTKRDTAGRGRVASLGIGTVTHLDIVEDEAVTYWYWIKITRPDSTIWNIGPIATPSAIVWTP